MLSDQWKAGFSVACGRERFETCTLAGAFWCWTCRWCKRQARGTTERLIAEAVAKLPPDQLAASAAGSPHSRRAAPITLRSSTLLRLNSVASLAARLLN
jgi:hypothetical protein